MSSYKPRSQDIPATKQRFKSANASSSQPRPAQSHQVSPKYALLSMVHRIRSKSSAYVVRSGKSHSSLSFSVVYTRNQAVLSVVPVLLYNICASTRVLPELFASQSPGRGRARSTMCSQRRKIRLRPCRIATNAQYWTLTDGRRPARRVPLRVAQRGSG